MKTTESNRLPTWLTRARVVCDPVDTCGIVQTRSGATFIDVNFAARAYVDKQIALL